jgi:hypothetical protein
LEYYCQLDRVINFVKHFGSAIASGADAASKISNPAEIIDKGARLASLVFDYLSQERLSMLDLLF